MKLTTATLIDLTQLYKDYSIKTSIQWTGMRNKMRDNSVTNVFFFLFFFKNVILLQGDDQNFVF